MTVTVLTSFGDGLYVPYRGLSKGDNPAGTYSHIMSGVGDGSGGTIVLRMRMQRLEFGFHPILTLVIVEATDNTAAVDQVLFQYEVAPGNERLSTALTIPKDSLVSVTGSRVVFLGQDLPIPIEPVSEVLTGAFLIQYQTNTNAANYNVRLFGMLWDAEVLARSPNRLHVPEQFFGVR